MLIDAARFSGPLAAGSNFTVIKQEALAPRLCGQLFVSMKSLGFVPAKTIPEIPSEVAPLFDTVTVWAELVVPAGCEPKFRLDADRTMVGPTAVPVNDTVCGLPVALSLRDRLAFFVPVVDGVKLTVTVQVAAAATVPFDGQGLLPSGIIAKLLAPPPTRAIDEIFSAALP